jgi:hypothetical protein
MGDSCAINSARRPGMGRGDDGNEDELEELEGPAEEMEGEATASKDSLDKEQPPHQHQVGERA